ncbi:MAG: TetR/AcrR family transcriptional regulator [Deltaproteobacteria bacterium]|jgi:TetR/AcrR family fatty acid metabolism transcriptional regulator
MEGITSSTGSQKERLIFQAALKVIKEKGYHRARISDIAREAGISYGLVYHYFKNKEDLFDTILRHWWEGMFQLMEDIRLREQDAAIKLKQLILYFFNTYQADPELVNVFITEISRSTANLTSTRLTYFKECMSRIQELIQEGQTSGTFREDLNPRYLTYIFLGAIETLLSAMVLEDRRITGDEQKSRMADTILEVFLHGAGNRMRRH